MEILTVAKFFKTDPSAVENWSIVNYRRRLQYMHIFQEINKPRGEDDPLPGERIWTPPNG